MIRAAERSIPIVRGGSGKRKSERQKGREDETYLEVGVVGSVEQSHTKRQLHSHKPRKEISSAGLGIHYHVQIWR